MRKNLIDMSGKKIGRLTVIDYAGNGFWNCQCECGNTVQRNGRQLRRTVKSSCGCWREEISRENGRSKKKQLEGTRSGSLAVIKCLDNTIGREIYECKCDCGNIVCAERRYLVDGSKTHCGCKNRKDMTGQKIGRVTVLGFAGIGKHGTALWNCKCDCGNEKIIDGALLRNGMSVSCGCLKRDAATEAQKKYNQYKIDGDVVRVELSNSDKEMLCDIDDWECLKKYCWAYGTGGYARTNVPKGDDAFSAFHMNVIDCPDGFVRDHINRNRLDNRKENLRIASLEINARNTNISKNNTSGFKGVTYSKRQRKYIAQISVGSKTYCLGKFDNALDAYTARLDGEKKYFGEIYSPDVSECVGPKQENDREAI